MRRPIVIALSALLLLGLLPAGAGAQPEPPRGREALQELFEDRGPRDAQARRAPAARPGPPGSPIPDPPVEENRDLPPGLIPYHEVAGVLRDLDARSDRVVVEVFGQSAGGRDLYLVTVADPRTGDLRADLRFRELMTRDPERARREAERNPRLRNPLWVHGSIHGNEWEGTDAALALIERLAFSDDPETRAVLDENVLLFNVVANPDGRVLGTRRNAADIDLNRDFATRSQPETRAVVDQFVKWNPAGLYDLHGYVDPMLIEPATAPHNPNYEYDLYIKWALPAAQAMRANVVAQGVPIDEPDIPFEEYPRGDWDDWPPIFTPMYAMYHGTVGHTLESPLRQNGRNVGLPPAERQRRGEVNTAAHVSAVWGAMRYMTANAQQVMLDQVEIFRRGDAAVPPASDPFLEPEGNNAGYPSPREAYTADPPDAYVVPVGDGQRSETAARRLVEHLLANGIEVTESARPVTAGGVAHPRGSFVVDMAQPRRGLANTFLEPGYDLTPVTPQMYDISGWSHSALWGATVVAAEDIDVRGRPLRGEARTRVELPRATAYALEVTDPSSIRAVNALLDAGVEVVRLADGRMAVPASAAADLRKAGEAEGLDVAPLDGIPADAVDVEPVRVAALTFLDQQIFLRDLGFDVTPVTAADLATISTDDYDVLVVTTGSYASLPPPTQANVQAFFAAGGGFVAWNRSGANFNRQAAVLPVEFAHVPPGTATPNGVTRVTHDPASPIVSGYPAADTSFVFSPVWFPVVGPGVRVDERFAAGDFLVAGHWIGQEAAAGQPSLVSGTGTTGNRAVLFGTDPLFRDHPKGLFGQMAQALYWASGS